MYALKVLGCLVLSVFFVVYCAQRAANQSRRDGVTMDQNTLTRTEDGPLSIVVWIGVSAVVAPFIIAWFF